MLIKYSAMSRPGRSAFVLFYINSATCGTATMATSAVCARAGDSTLVLATPNYPLRRSVMA